MAASMEMEKIAIFVDVQNIYYTTRQHFHRQFNYQAFWNKATAKKTLVAAYAYAIDKGDRQQQRFQNTLQRIGFQIKLKPYIQRSDGSAKGDWDVGITLDAIEAAASVDCIILLSGDGDFDLLLNKARTQYNTKSIVYGVSSLTAPSLINAASQYIAIDDSLLL